MDFLREPAFWWAVIASLWAVTSDYLGTNPRVKQNATYQLLFDLISRVIRGRAKAAGMRRRGRR